MIILSAEDVIQKPAIIKTLKENGIVIMLCDTVYGFVGAVPDTGKRIASIKGREEEKKFLQLILPSWLCRFTDTKIEEELLDISPGCVTFIVKNRHGDTTAVRFPKDPFLADIIAGVGKPLYSTSVNRSGKDILSRPVEMIKEFGNEIDLLLDAGEITGKKPSTILDVTTKPYRIIRPGAGDIPSKYLI